jgi:hypothetical protein
MALPAIDGFDTPEQAILAHAIARYRAAAAEAVVAAAALHRAALAAIQAEDSGGRSPALLTAWQAAIEAGGATESPRPHGW